MLRSRRLWSIVLGAFSLILILPSCEICAEAVHATNKQVGPWRRFANSQTLAASTTASRGLRAPRTNAPSVTRGPITLSSSLNNVDLGANQSTTTYPNSDVSESAFISWYERLIDYAATPAPATGIYTYVVPPTGTGGLYATACEVEHMEWSSSSSQWFVSRYGYTTMAVSTMSPLISTSLFTYTFGTIPNASTLCDGAPRAFHDWFVPTTTATYSSFVTMSTTDPANDRMITAIGPPIVPYTVQSPSCSVQPQDCTPFVSSWMEHNSEYVSNAYAAGSSLDDLYQVTTNIVGDYPPLFPHCRAITTTDCGPCSVGGGYMTLLYFPVSVSTLSGDLCNGDCEYCAPLQRAHTDNNNNQHQRFRNLEQNLSSVVDKPMSHPPYTSGCPRLQLRISVEQSEAIRRITDISRVILF